MWLLLWLRVLCNWETVQAVILIQTQIIMNKREQLIQKYANDLRIKCNINPDMNLLTKVTINCGPSIYNKDASMVSSTDPSEVDTIRNNFLIKKLKLRESPLLVEGINQVFELYGLSNRNKYRAVVYYLLTKHFGKESIF